MNTTVTFMESPATGGVLHITDNDHRTLCGAANSEMGGLPVSTVDPVFHSVCWDCAQVNQTSGQRIVLPEWMRQKHLMECVEQSVRILHANDNLHSGPHMLVETTLIRVQQYLAMLPTAPTNGFVPPIVVDEDLASTDA